MISLHCPQDAQQLKLQPAQLKRVLSQLRPGRQQLDKPQNLPRDQFSRDLLIYRHQEQPKFVQQQPTCQEVHSPMELIQFQDIHLGKSITLFWETLILILEFLLAATLIQHTFPLGRPQDRDQHIHTLPLKDIHSVPKT